jgi:hypothetical protein
LLPSGVHCQKKRNEKPGIFPPLSLLRSKADMFDVEGLLRYLLLPNLLLPAAGDLVSVPMANILAILPKTKLIFRPADAFVSIPLVCSRFCDFGSLKQPPRLISFWPGICLALGVRLFFVIPTSWRVVRSVGRVF